MATPRREPFVWVTWLAKVMAGEVSCHWQAWFQILNKLDRKRVDTAFLVERQIEHSRMVSYIATQYRQKGIRYWLNTDLKLRLLNDRVTLCGKPDLIIDRPDRLTVIDCKTGSPKQSHTVQVMLYAYMMSQHHRFGDRPVRGFIAHRGERVEVPAFPSSFPSQVEYFVEWLVEGGEPSRAPGSDCMRCPITSDDCPERVETITDHAPLADWE
jgi:hypothetical protein